MKLKLQVVQKKALTALAIHNTLETPKEDWDEWAEKAKITISKGEHSAAWLMLRWKLDGVLVCGIPPNSWAVLQENKDIRVYSDEKFHLIYETL